MNIANWRNKRRTAAALLLLALLFRAYVPVGFMPAAGSFALEICPDGLPDPHALHHAGHAAHGAHLAFQHCPFGAVPGAGPAPDLALALPGREIVCAPLPAFEVQSAAERRQRAHPARAPPILA